MKKVKFSGKLSLNKETIANLNDEQMNTVNGGYLKTDEQACAQTAVCVPFSIGCPAYTDYQCNGTMGCLRTVGC